MTTPHRLSRRRFLQATAAATTAASLAPHLHAAEPAHNIAWPENGTLIPDDGWHLWLDTEAKWQEDDIFLPEDIAWINDKLCAKGQPLPVNTPTGGWAALTPAAGKQVVLPTTVEQHFWGAHSSRPYTPEEYRYAAPATNPAPPADDNIPQNGAYFGVSWFYREIDIPAFMRGQRIFLHVRGAHLRAEVYLNGQLCGYSIMEELPFEADLTHAAQSGGTNLLAIRITNPFGRFDWVDGLNAKWHNVSLYRSHGFGGIDRGMTISASPQTHRIIDAYVLNTPRKDNAVVVRGTYETAWHQKNPFLEVVIDLLDPATGKKIWTSVADDFFPIAQEPSTTKGSGYIEFNTLAGLVECERWDFEAPKMYQARIRVQGRDGHTDTRTIAFGFRSITVDGLGTNALFRINGRRLKIYSAISWGFWGLNGMFPVPELAEKEVTAAKALGLNALNFHRNLAKEDVLRAHDRHGLLRYLEPGAGRLAIGKLPTGTAANANSVVMEDARTEAERFAQRYMFVKCVEMVKAHRSHPSVFEYCLQNELGADLKNPATLAVLEAMHDADPSRMVVLNDGFVGPPRNAAQAWYEPWDAAGNPGKLHRSDVEPFGAWWINHQGAGDQWYDEFYKSPTEYTYNSPGRAFLTEYGEMEGCARPDVHGLMIDQITKTYAHYGGTSYDLTDHREIYDACDRFLTRWNFRAAFPTPDHVFRAVGRTAYESWANYMENARINDDLDMAVISGWESTSIENHSGIVDNLRNFKSDPALIADSLRPVRPIAKQRTLAVEQGQPAVFDLYLANDTGKPVTGELVLTVISPKGVRTELFRCTAPAQSRDVFSYLLKEAFTTPVLDEEGLYRFRFALSSDSAATHTKEIWVTGAGQEIGCNYAPHVAVSGIASKDLAKLRTYGEKHCLNFTDFKVGETYRAIITSGITAHTGHDASTGETTGLESLPPTKPGHKPEPGETPQTTQLGTFAPGILDQVRASTPLLVIAPSNTLAEGLARELAAAGAFAYSGAVGDFRAPWMGNWYFARRHPLLEGLPQDCALGGFYQAPGRQSNGLLIERAPGAPDPEIVIAYSRDHDRRIGAGTFICRLGKGKIVFHRTPEFHPVLQQRFLANAIRWLTMQT